MGVLRSLCIVGLFWCSVGVSPASEPAIPRYEVTPQRNPDAACQGCHKPELQGMHGLHAQAINPGNKRQVTCTHCHGNASLQHREGARDVMRFNQPLYRVEQQNSVCLTCHQPDALQQIFWPHGVHITRVTCAGCHTLHSRQEPMRALDDKGRIRICVDCHREQQSSPHFNPASVPVLKERP
ncbi:cytochrome c nitrite reductase pentaheme subunit [Shimwellia blattae]|uniref:Cytochrome c-type protein NrfB n=1 Tax=Shimwellia blattae (strain ATCC 29907 / DSM 4481 / JCM 1650 / NBRC 105725 / CDC 9005-74) TaxID=630626 RepID=I2BC97_SHIBC|nr:cytochrome c nitrite reductase pentaheme subunit [Shimwellia blattae]AFJ48151.1 cytochrome c-type protein NrfB precursor [Shimwellia blattae DSM 4481 = NBRC 105725]GAB83187.1 cytochrome c-type protein NrfB [Shimwellia blattae DSM 4481 = NBRC 105725]VDY65647.1 Cytochrome c-type protein NrfB precursor [Shimwellia blattae]VEC25223.1 Cytochrome c-type protein NrfB precursor [Shimwellia blattae]